MKIPQVAALVVLLILAAAGKTSASDGLITKPSVARMSGSEIRDC
jgi:hypothetical protein